jgi:hypothetical protein
MKLFILIILLAFSILSCSTNDNSREVIEAQILENDRIKDINMPRIPDSVVDRFDSKKMTKSLNEFIPRITNLPKEFICEIDTLLKDSIGKQKLDILFNKGSNVISYKFDCGDYFKNINVIRATYSDSVVSNRVFARLNNQIIDGSFCLSKTNELIIVTDFEIYWLHGSCIYPYYNFKKIERIFENSLIDGSINDLIKCKCGGKIVSH